MNFALAFRTRLRGYSGEGHAILRSGTLYLMRSSKLNIIWARIKRQFCLRWRANCPPTYSLHRGHHSESFNSNHKFVRLEKEIFESILTFDAETDIAFEEAFTFCMLVTVLVEVDPFFCHPSSFMALAILVVTVHAGSPVLRLARKLVVHLLILSCVGSVVSFHENSFCVIIKTL